MKRRDQIALVLFAISPLLYAPFAFWLTTTRVGTSLCLHSLSIYLLPLGVAILAAPVWVFCLVWRRTRRHTCFFLLVFVLLFCSTFAGFYVGQKLRMNRMQLVAVRSRPLINAINQYQRDHATPPPSLGDLIPDYLPAVPATGMMAYPEYEYRTGEDVPEWYPGNPWVLSVSTPLGGINFDEMLYFPNQQYPERLGGERLEPVADWAYFHE